MTRAELKQRIVLASICDDHEDIQQITSLVGEMASACGLVISHDEIVQVLAELVHLGYAWAWDAEPRKPEPPEELPGMPLLEEIGTNVCFRGTPEGLNAYMTRSFQPPVYSGGKLRRDWVPPAEPLSRNEQICILALACIWDGYVTLSFTQMRMDDLALRLETTFTQEEILNALRKLVGRGYAKAWPIDRGDPPIQYEGMPPREHIVPWRAYFYVTEEGMAYHRSGPDWWPSLPKS